MLTHKERRGLFERLKEDVEADVEYKRMLLETIIKSAGGRLL